VRLRVGLLPVLPAELDDEPALPFRHQVHVLRVHADRLHVLDEDVVDSLEPGRLVLQHLWNLVGGLELAVPAEHEQRLVLRARDQVHRRLEHRDARALGADERRGDVEVVLRQQVVEVVAGHAPWDVRIALADQRRVAVAQLRELPVDLRIA
jgi:hypothetical protein